MTSPLPIFITSKVPGVEPSEMTEWKTICRNPPFVIIGHDKMRTLSRWTVADRRKPFSVKVYSRGRTVLRVSDVCWYYTLEKARAGAAEKAAWWAESFARWAERRKAEAQQATPS